jgi:hypothetical protein
MTYSRRELYALGEPLGDSATRKVAGKTIYGGGGGGSQPTSTTQTTTTIPEYARPYAERALGQAAALTDINQNPYQTYQGERFAQFTPLQQKSFEGAYGMETAGQLGTGTGLSTAAGLGGLGMVGAYNPYQTGQFTGGAAGQYMSPYMQNVVDIEKREAQRASDIAAQRDKGAFARAGAFGGARQAIVEAERARNLATQMGDIQAKGTQGAYQQAMDQFNREQQLREQSRQYGAGLGMQGLQAANQAAATLGGLGQQQFQQGMDINKLQQQYGTQQQSQVQNIMNAQYQDFLNAKQYPYQQLGFMSDVLRGLPLSQSYSQTYQQPPSMLGQLAGIGMGAYGMFGKKDGGSVHAYADGGMATPYEYAERTEPVVRMAYGGDVTSDNFVEGAINRLSSQQLQIARRIALDRRDVKRLKEIDEELAERNQAQSYAPSAEEGMARGGMVAFKNGGDKGEYTYEGLEKLGKELETLREQARPAGGSRQIVADPTIRERAETARAALPGKEKEYEAYALKFDPSLGKAAFADPTSRATGMRVQPEVAPAVRVPGRGIAAAMSAAGAGRGGDEAYKNYNAAEAAESLAKVPMRGEKSSLTSKENSNADRVATAMATATGASSKDMMGHVKAMYEWLKEGDKEMFDAVNARIDQIKKEAKEVKAGAKMRALAQFGFQMAAAAAQPGAGRGIAGALRSAASAAPTISKSMGESEDLYRRLMDTTNKLEIASLQAKQAAAKGDKVGALQFANMERQLAAQQAQIGETIRHNKAVEGLTAQRYKAGDQKYAMQMAQLPMQARKQAAYEINNELKTNPGMYSQIASDPKAVERMISERAKIIQQSPLMGMVSNLREVE